MGHRKGMETAYKITQACSKLGIKVLTFYTFSTENWRRPKEEVNFLMELLKGSFERYKNKLKEDNIYFRVIGELEELPEDIKIKVNEVMELTKNNTGMILNIALNYGGRREILNAVKKIAERVKNGEILPQDITEELFSNYLYTGGLPDPDLLIRTAGELRLSNFLLWQVSYTEFYFTKKLWPDFTVGDLKKAINDFRKRERRFGSIKDERIL